VSPGIVLELKQVVLVSDSKKSTMFSKKPRTPVPSKLLKAASCFVIHCLSTGTSMPDLISMLELISMPELASKVGRW